MKELMDVSVDRLEELSYDKSKMNMSLESQIMSQEELEGMTKAKESASTP